MKYEVLRLFVTVCLCVFCTNGVPRYEEITVDNEVNKIIDDENPLILTDLLNEGRVKEGQAAARVTSFERFDKIESYSGYFKIDERFDSNVFFWFFPSKMDYLRDPFILWLQGGPGSSSLNGLFFENGPFHLNADKTLTLREHTWINHHSMIYMDSPVGAGFSYTSKNGYAENQTAVGNGLCKALIQFFKLFPEIQQNDFYIIGESYAGKYIPAVARSIHYHNLQVDGKINLKGFAIGGGLFEPKIQFQYSETLYQIGLIDLNVKTRMSNLEKIIFDCINNKDYMKGFMVWESVLGLFVQASDFSNLYNYLEPSKLLYDYDLLTSFINQKEIKSALHVGENKYIAQSYTAHSFLIPDIMQSIAPWFAELLNHYRVLVYNGQLDSMIIYSKLEEFLLQLEFSGADEYKAAKRNSWYVGDDLAGYVKCGGNLTEALVRKAGHSIPTDQPAWTLDLITKFTSNKPLY